MKTGIHLPLLFLSVAFLSCKKSGEGEVTSNPPDKKDTGHFQPHPKTDRPAAADAEKVRQELGSISGPLTPHQRSVAVDFFLHGDIDACKEVLAQMPIGDDYNSLLMRFAQRYGQEDLPGAIEWLKSASSGPEMQTAYILIGNAAAKDPDMANKFAGEIKDPGLKKYFVSNYITGLSAANNWQALDKIVHSKDEQGKLGLSGEDLILALGSAKLSSASLPLSMGYISDVLKDFDKPYQTIDGTTIQSLVGQDPASAADYLSRNKDAKGVAEVFSGPLVTAWAAKDAKAAGDWLLTQSGSVREYGAAGMASALAGLQPEAAAQWAVSITDPKLRQQALGSVMRDAVTGRDAVKAVIESGNLPAEERDRYLKALSQR